VTAARLVALIRRPAAATFSRREKSRGDVASRRDLVSTRPRRRHPLRRKLSAMRWAREPLEFSVVRCKGAIRDGAGRRPASRPVCRNHDEARRDASETGCGPPAGGETVL